MPRLAASAGEVAAIVVDLDGFKAVNDSAGHQVGDAVLREIAARSASAAGPEDLVARTGGDEFLVVCSGAKAAAAADRTRGLLLDALATPVEVDGDRWTVGASVGVAIAPTPVSFDDLLGGADQAMYDVKRSRRLRDGSTVARRRPVREET